MGLRSPREACGPASGTGHAAHNLLTAHKELGPRAPLSVLALGLLPGTCWASRHWRPLSSSWDGEGAGGGAGAGLPQCPPATGRAAQHPSTVTPVGSHTHWHPFAPYPPSAEDHGPQLRTTDRAGQPEAEPGGGPSGSRPSSRGQHPQGLPPPLRASVYPSGRWGGRLASRALTSLTVSSAPSLPTDGFVPQILSAYCVPVLTTRSSLCWQPPLPRRTPGQPWIPPLPPPPPTPSGRLVCWSSSACGLLRTGSHLAPSPICRDSRGRFRKYLLGPWPNK